MQKIKKFIEKNIIWIILFICLVGFIYLLEEVYRKEIMRADIIGYNLVSKYLISDYTIPIAKIITNLGGTICLCSIAIISIVAIKSKKIGISIAINLLVVAVLNFIIKNIVQRQRPTEYRLVDESGYSFPSGHSMVSMAFYGYIIYLIYKNVENKYLKISLITLLCILILSIGTSRIFLGVHYTSDVLAGFLISISYLILYIKSINKFYLNVEK